MKTFKTLMAATAAVCLMSGAALAAGYESYESSPVRSSGTTVIESMTHTLAPQHVREVQRVLAGKGFYDGRVDGVWGPRTTAAIRGYQRSMGQEPTGMLTTGALSGLGIEVDDMMR